VTGLPVPQLNPDPETATVTPDFASPRPRRIVGERMSGAESTTSVADARIDVPLPQVAVIVCRPGRAFAGTVIGGLRKVPSRLAAEMVGSFRGISQARVIGDPGRTPSGSSRGAQATNPVPDTVVVAETRTSDRARVSVGLAAVEAVSTTGPTGRSVVGPVITPPAASRAVSADTTSVRGEVAGMTREVR
jgi:hypothetical protein